MRCAPAQVSHAGERRPAGGGVAGDAGGVEDPHGASAAAVVEGGVEEVVLDAGGDDRPAPFEQRGDGEAGGLAAAGRADDGEAGLGFGGDEVPTETAEGEAPGLGFGDGEAAQVSGFGQPAGPVDTEPPWVWWRLSGLVSQVRWRRLRSL